MCLDHLSTILYICVGKNFCLVPLRNFVLLLSWLSHSENVCFSTLLLLAETKNHLLVSLGYMVNVITLNFCVKNMPSFLGKCWVDHFHAVSSLLPYLLGCIGGLIWSCNISLYWTLLIFFPFGWKWMSGESGYFSIIFFYGPKMYIHAALSVVILSE